MVGQAAEGGVHELALVRLTSRYVWIGPALLEPDIEYAEQQPPLTPRVGVVCADQRAEAERGLGADAERARAVAQRERRKCTPQLQPVGQGRPERIEQRHRAVPDVLPN